LASPEDPEILREPLSAVDHAWLRMDEPSNLMVINAVQNCGVITSAMELDPPRDRR